MDANETDLPFVGTKMSVHLEGGKRVDVVIHSDGTRDVSFVAAGSETASHVFRLDAASACAVGALLCAAVQSPGAD